MTKLTFLFLTLAFPLIATAQTTPFPKPFNSEPDTNSAPMAAAEAAAKMQLPAGFKASVFAAEPDVRNPIAMTWDARGRLWVAENYTYAEQSKKFELGLRDRVLIFEDGKGDGHFSSRKVFTDDVQMLTSVEVGHGGVWLMCPPQLLFIPDRNGDDLPDGPAQVVLDGFAMADMYHNLANGLRFGPDGWLYGRCGGSCPGEIGLPGTPKEQRVPLRGGIWRYHPGRKVVEVLNSGTTNPWGHDWDAHGELFFINTVNGHLWHGITGSHLKRIASIPDPNPRAYELIEQHADHWHFDTTGDWSKSRDGSASALGGGHAHMGMMIYQGDNWPAEYRGGLFTENFHGRRLNREILERSGSGYVGRHGQDFLFSPDPWFRGLDLSTGPDGGVFVMDWSDTGECHDFTGVHRESGRIFKITHSEPRRVEPFDLAKLDERALVKLHTHANEWFVRQARLELAGRAANGSGLNDAKARLRAMFDQDADAVNKLRALWTLFVMGATDENFLAAQLHHDNEHVRAWAVRLLSDAWPLDTTLSQRPTGSAGFQAEAATLAAFVRLAREDSSALVRLVLASALQRLPAAQRIELAGALVAHAEDADDHNLPLLIWYGLIPVGDADPLALARLAETCELPITRKFIARRLAEDIEKSPAPVNALLQLTAAKPESFQADILAGLGEGLAGWRKAKKPTAWDAFASQLAKVTSPVIRDRVRDLSALFGDGRALDEVKRVALDPTAAVDARKAALQTLIENRPPDLRQICEQSLDTFFLNAVAARGLAQFDDPALARTMLGKYYKFSALDRPVLMDVLASRPTFARVLLDAVEQGRIPRAMITVFHVRQIRSFNDDALNAQLKKVWGELREPAADKKALIAKVKTRLTPDALTKADLGTGRVLFTRVCAACHRLYGQGGDIGPDLTGAGRDNLDYLLENIGDPSAVVNADFRMSVLSLEDGRVLNGVIKTRTAQTLTLKTVTGTLTVARSDIESLQESALSMMPDGQLEALPLEQVRDLIAYLMHKTQVPLPAAK